MTDLAHLTCPDCHTGNRIPAERLDQQPHCGHCKAALFQGEPITATTATLPGILRNTDLPIVIDFWAPWCGPCKAFAPIFRDAAHSLEPNIRFVKVDTEAEPALASHYAIRSIPTLMIIHHGNEVARKSGAMQGSQLRQWLVQELLGDHTS